MSKTDCVNCKYFHGYDGVNELYVSCALHGDFKVKAVKCNSFEKKVTGADLLKKIHSLENEIEVVRMTERFALKEDGLHDKETDRIFQLDNNLTRVLNTLDKMMKCHLIRIHAQDEYIQKLEARLEELDE